MYVSICPSATILPVSISSFNNILLYDKKQEIAPTDKKTDFFYKGDQYDRKYDERADKNNYRTM